MKRKAAKKRPTSKAFLEEFKSRMKQTAQSVSKELRSADKSAITNFFLNMGITLRVFWEIIAKVH